MKRIFSKRHRRNLSKNHADVSGSNNPMFGVHIIGKDHWNYDKKQPRKTRKKISKSVKKWHKNNLHPFLNKHHTFESIRKMIRTHKRVCKDPVYVEKLRRCMKDRWKDPAFVKKLIPKILPSNFGFPNNKEKFLRYLLRFIVPKMFKYVGDGRFIIDKRNPDFIRVDGRKKQVIELFGTHWHRKGEGRKKKRYYERNGYDCLIIWERELKSPERLLWKILEFVEKEAKDAKVSGG